MNSSASCAVRCALALVLASVVATGVGCGSAKYDSPQAVYDEAKAAAEAEDYEKLCACMTSESQDMLAGVMVMSGVMMRGMAVGMAAMGGDAEKAEAEKKFAPLDAVLTKHGVSPEELEKEEPDMDVQSDPQAAMTKLAERIKDKPAFIGDMITVMQSLDEKLQQGGPADAFKATLSDVKIEGDKANGMVAQPDTPDQKNPIHFKKVDGGWLIDMAAEIGS